MLLLFQTHDRLHHYCSRFSWGQQCISTVKGRERVPRCPLKHQWNGPVSTRKTLNLLIDMLVNPLVLAYPDFNLPFVLHTDASERGLGAILYQHQDGGLWVIAYSSRTLSPAKKNYRLHSGKLEFFCIKVGGM